MQVDFSEIDDTTEESHQNQILNFYIGFSDLMVLLCVFFVMIQSMSEVNTGSFEKLKTQFTGSKKGTLVELAERLQEISSQQEGVKVWLDEDGVRMDLESAALFETGSSVLRESAVRPLMPLLQEIRSTKYKIDVEGHTDDVAYYRRHSSGEIETNWSLSGRRASRFVLFLLEKVNIQERRIRVVGYASNRPRVPVAGVPRQELPQVRAQNRRVSLLVH